MGGQLSMALTAQKVVLAKSDGKWASGLDAQNGGCQSCCQKSPYLEKLLLL